MSVITKAQKTWKKRPILLYIFCCLVFLFMMLPVVIVVLMSLSGADFLEFPPSNISLRWYREFLSNQKWMGAAWNSIRVASGTMVLSVFTGLLAALGLTNKAIKKKKPFNMILMLPLMIPSIIVAVSLYFAFAKWNLIGTYTSLILAHSCLALPFVVILISSSLYGVDPQYYDAARTLGAGHFTSIRLVVLPLIKPAIFSSILFSFITSFDEIIIASFICKIENITLPKVMFDHLKFSIHPMISAVSTILIFITITALLFNFLGKSAIQKINTGFEKDKADLQYL